MPTKPTSEPEPADPFAGRFGAHWDVVVLADEPAQDRGGGVGPILFLIAQASVQGGRAAPARRVHFGQRAHQMPTAVAC
jgi:hypothetical protein